MNEPKKSVLEAAAYRKWPAATGLHINQRKHTLAVTFGGTRKHPHDFVLSARTHRELLHTIENA